MQALYVYVIVGAVLAGFVQGLSGFAFGMVAMSIWAWTLEPQLAAVLALFGALTGQVIAAVTVRRSFDKRILWPFVLGGLVGVPFGVWLLPHLDLVMFKLCLGVLLVLWCPAMLMSQHLPKVAFGGRVADGVAGAIGGAMAGIGGFSGTIPTLWCTLRGFQRDTQRAVIQNFNLSMLSVAFAVHVASGSIGRSVLPLLVLVAAAVAVPVLLGARLYIGISEVAFRKIVLSLLTLSGIAMLASAVPVLLSR
ncbi:sulfite exporter TauE/SafE family protein [Acidovorax cavernicola]|uniref:Probable membrane transporter protein n=1 Tax=Acidovorax cavernicola TaxID=1675792 RepID=A0A9X8D6J8_9BURK|nr:sulfite exporter TauE/SafE family protein [Acidovorax cavernicola]RIX81623.1 sulfite exporter TauE/SafE family protein [Acidovorax cavernicola]